MHWNVITAYIGSNTKIRAADPTDIAAAGPLLAELLALLRSLRVVILGGGAAQRTWDAHAPAGHGLTVIRYPHPSPTNINTRPGSRELVVGAWTQALAVTRR